QPVELAEAPKAGDCSRYTIELSLAGNLIVTQEDGRRPIRLEAKARHRFADRTLDASDGMPARSARHYDEAIAKAVIGADTVEHTLPADRRLVAARRSPD